MNNERLPDGGSLSSLELLGLLSSKIIHDLKNKLAIIAGHAQFAEMTRQNPKVMADTIATVRRVSEEASKNLDHLSKLRRALPQEHSQSPWAMIEPSVNRLLARRPGWELRRAAETASLVVAMPAPWIVFVLAQILRTVPPGPGVLTVERGRAELPVEGVEVAPLDPDREFLRLTLAGAPELTPAPAEPATALAEFEALAAQELLRRMSGGLWRQTGAADHFETRLFLPLALPPVP
mgnify:CR=1 FL=1